jgi:hypothetical protein
MNDPHDGCGKGNTEANAFTLQGFVVAANGKGKCCSGLVVRWGVDILRRSLQRTVRGPAHLFPATPDFAQELQLKVFTEAR